MTGAERIAAERMRQVSDEGWTADHDAEHSDGELAMAAACYASFAVGDQIYVRREYATNMEFADPWPWDRGWDKRMHIGTGANYPRYDLDLTVAQRVEFLVKAGALIAAEIDRLLRERAARARSEEKP